MTKFYVPLALLWIAVMLLSVAVYQNAYDYQSICFEELTVNGNEQYTIAKENTCAKPILVMVKRQD